MNGHDIDLRRLQEIMCRLMVAPTGVAEALAQGTILPVGGLESLVAGDDRMTPVERVEIYANGYFYRILDVLKEDYPAALAVVGADNFHNLATGYLIDYPPTEPSIYYAGQHFARYLATHPWCERFPVSGRPRTARARHSGIFSCGRGAATRRRRDACDCARRLAGASPANASGDAAGGIRVARRSGFARH